MNVEFYGFNDPQAQEILVNSVATLEPKSKRISISFNHDPSNPTPKQDFNVLILWEPSAVMPWQYQAKIRKRFDLVIPMSCWRAEDLGEKNFAFHPYTVPQRYKKNKYENRSRSIVMINSAKFSAGQQSNYGLRRSVSRELHRLDIDYELFGSEWKMSKRKELFKRWVAFKNSIRAHERISFSELTSEYLYKFPEYRGHVDDKLRVLGESKMSLVIENQSDWVTEKLFDSIIAGSVPIYIGPVLGKYFPAIEKCLIRSEPNVLSILETISQVTEELLLKKRKAMDTFLSDNSEQGLSFWSPENQWSRVGEIIANHIRIN